MKKSTQKIDELKAEGKDLEIILLKKQIRIHQCKEAIQDLESEIEFREGQIEHLKEINHIKDEEEDLQTRIIYAMAEK